MCAAVHGYLPGVHPGGTCPKSVETCWQRQPAGLRRWGGRGPTPAGRDPAAESAPARWAAAAPDRTGATASPEHTQIAKRVKGMWLWRQDKADFNESDQPGTPGCPHPLNHSGLLRARHC